MPHAVMFARFGGPEVLELVPMTKPSAGAGQVVVEVMAAGLNPGESAIREGRRQDQWPISLPSGQGTDFAGFIVDIGSGVVGWNMNDPVFGHAVRSAQASFVTVPAENILHKPERLRWEIAGSLYVAATNAWEAVARANPVPGETVLVQAAAGAVGGIAAQLARLRGATVIGTASPDHFDHLRQIGVLPVEYGPGLDLRLAALAPDGIDAELDHLGNESLMNVESTDQSDLASVAVMIANHQISVPVAAIYPLEHVQDAYRELEVGHAHGKVVLSMMPVGYTNQKVRGIDMREREATIDDPNRPPYPRTVDALPPVIGHLPGHPHPRPGFDAEVQPAVPGATEPAAPTATPGGE